MFLSKITIFFLNIITNTLSDHLKRNISIYKQEKEKEKEKSQLNRNNTNDNNE